MINQKLKDLRTKLGLTQEKIALEFGVSVLTYSRWERGICNPSPLAREKLDALNKKLGRAS